MKIRLFFFFPIWFLFLLSSALLWCDPLTTVKHARMQVSLMKGVGFLLCLLKFPLFGLTVILFSWLSCSEERSPDTLLTRGGETLVSVCSHNASVCWKRRNHTSVLLCVGSGCAELEEKKTQPNKIQKTKTTTKNQTTNQNKKTNPLFLFVCFVLLLGWNTGMGKAKRVYCLSVEAFFLPTQADHCLLPKKLTSAPEVATQ